MKPVKNIRTHGIFITTMLVLLTFGTSLHAQMPHIFKAYSSPKYPSSADTTLIIDSVMVPSIMSYIENKTAEVNGFNIKVVYCYKDTQSFALVDQRLDTAAFPNLPDGLYHCSIYTKQINTEEPPYCDSIIYRDSIKFTFTVGSTAIHELETEQISFSPNPVKRILYLRTSLSHFITQVFDATGRIIATNTDTKDLDVSTLPSGIFLLRLQHDQGNVVKRFVKE